MKQKTQPYEMMLNEWSGEKRAGEFTIESFPSSLSYEYAMGSSGCRWACAASKISNFQARLQMTAPHWGSSVNSLTFPILSNFPSIHSQTAWNFLIVIYIHFTKESKCLVDGVAIRDFSYLPVCPETFFMPFLSCSLSSEQQHRLKWCHEAQLSS